MLRNGNLSDTHFLNVDLDIYSRSNLKPLVDAMSGDVSVLFAGRVKGRNEAHLELSAELTRADTTGADKRISEFCDLVQRLNRKYVISGIKLIGEISTSACRSV